MTIFKTFLKVLNKCKVPVIMYTVILIIFGGFNMTTSENTMDFTALKPDIFIVNEDDESALSKNLVQYFEKNANLVDVKTEESAIDDALFYRDVSYVIYIPKGYEASLLNGENPEIKVKKTDDYEASLAEMLLERYSNITNTYAGLFEDKDLLIQNMNATIEETSHIEMTTTLNTSEVTKTTFYYNFFSYSMMAGAIYVICLILSSFQEENVRKRTIISSTDIKKQNRILLLSNVGFAIVLWAIYVLVSFFLIGEIMFTKTGYILMINAFIFSLVCVTLSLLISNIIRNKDAINGIVNVVALGSSFLCGAFVPVSMLPSSVLKVAHILPTYWFINTNERLKSIEAFHFAECKPILINMGVLIAFCILFMILNNFVSKKNQKIG